MSNGALPLHRTFFVLLAALAGGVACTPGPPRRPLLDRDPVFVIPAIKDAAKQEDYTDVPRLIELLRSDDSAVRAFSDEGLRRLTGQDFGYRYWADEASRKVAVGRWTRWAVDRRLLPASALPVVAKPDEADPAPPEPVSEAEAASR